MLLFAHLATASDGPIASPHLELAVQPHICLQVNEAKVVVTQVDTRVSHLSTQGA
jgi:hypothetical protein